MPGEPQRAFKSLAASSESLQDSTSSLSKQYAEFSSRLDEWRGEEQKLHQTVLEGTHALVEQASDDQDRLKRAREDSDQRFREYHRALEESARSTVGELEAPLDHVEALEEIMFRSIQGQVIGLTALNDVESESDRSRAQGLAGYAEELERAGRRLDEVSDSLSRAGVSLSASVQTRCRAETEHALRRGLELNKHAVEAYYRGQPKTAHVLLQEAVNLAPREPAIWLNLAQLCLDAGDVEHAARAWQQASDRASEATDVLHTAGLIALKRGDTDEAVESLAKCVALAVDPLEELRCRLDLARACYLNGSPDEAIQHWERVLELDPAQPLALAWIRSLE